MVPTNVTLQWLSYAVKHYTWRYINTASIYVSSVLCGRCGERKCGMQACCMTARATIYMTAVIIDMCTLCRQPVDVPHSSMSCLSPNKNVGACYVLYTHLADFYTVLKVRRIGWPLISCQRCGWSFHWILRSVVVFRTDWLQFREDSWLV